jgi:hypothetical protein
LLAQVGQAGEQQQRGERQIGQEDEGHGRARWETDKKKPSGRGPTREGSP